MTTEPNPHAILPWKDRTAFKIDHLLAEGKWGGSCLHALPLSPHHSVSLCLTLQPSFLPPCETSTCQETSVCARACAYVWVCVLQCDCYWHGGAKAPLLSGLSPLHPCLSLLVSSSKHKECEKGPHYKLLKGQGQAPF